MPTRRDTLSLIPSSLLLGGATGALTASTTDSIAAAQAQTQTVDTWIGRLELDVRYPSKTAAEKLYDEMDFQRATQAFIWALPAVGFQALRVAQLNSFGAKDGDVTLFQDLKDKEGMLTPNITTLYAFSFWNMKEKGPLVIEAHNGRLWAEAGIDQGSLFRISLPIELISAPGT
jgi:hypothetical protein